MSTLLIAVASFVGFIVAYHTYGRWLARRIFGLDKNATVPSHELRDDVDYVPTKKEVIFGHHFTSIAGTGPIVGPAIAVFWGWLPALLWVVFGSIFIGAVHDFGALIVSLRNRGQTVGEVAGRLISPRAKVLFLLVLFFALTIVLAIFGLVIAIIFKIYPESVLSVWIEIPLALGIGWWVHKRGGGLLIPSLIALGVMYLCIWVGVYYWQPDMAGFLDSMLGKRPADSFINPITVWTVILLVYCAIASVLPVWTLLQPRDYINSHELVVALGLLLLGLLVAGFMGAAHITDAPAVNQNLPANAPPIFPFLFITIACGAVSGFHCLVSSGTTSKQVEKEPDAQYVGYGAMLLEGALAVVVIIACCAGVGMSAKTESGETVTGSAAWSVYYPQERVVQVDGKAVTKSGWASQGLQQKLAAFVDGGANLLTSIGIPFKFGIGIIAVLVASFAATTLDTATRLQRYVVAELATTVKFKAGANKYVATGIAVAVGGAMAMLPDETGGAPGKGGLILWPLFGAVNQLLAGLALMVTVFYLWRRSKPILFAVVPMLLMLALPAWAMTWQLFNSDSGWLLHEKYLIGGIGLGVMGLQIWMVIEGLIVWRRARGVLEPALPPLSEGSLKPAPEGRSC